MQWLDDLRTAGSKEHEEKVPPGWRTNLEWAAEWKMSESQTRRILTAAVRTGSASEKVFRIRRGVGTYPTRHWKKK